MQLLYSRSLPTAEFVSIALILKGEISDVAICPMQDPMLLPSPVSTISRSTAADAVRELHRYLLSIQKVTRSGGNEDGIANSLLREDEKLLKETQVFRPANGQGIGLHYKLIRDRTALVALAQLSVRLGANPPEANVNAKAIEKEVAGVIFCVGVTGLPSIFSVSPVSYALGDRMNACIKLLSKTGTEDAASCSSLLASMLLTETESHLTNPMASAQEYHLFGESDDGRGGLLNPRKKLMATNHEVDFENPLAMNSADQARFIVERLAVLSVAETGTIFCKYEGKSNEKNTKARRRKAGKDADLDGFDLRSESSKKGTPIISSSVSVPDTASIKSGTSKLLQQPKKDTARIAGASLKPRQSSVPPLTASHKDTGPKAKRPIVADQSVKSRSGTRPQQASEPSLSSNGTAGNAVSFDPFSTPTVDTVPVMSDTPSSRRTQGTSYGNNEFGFDPNFGSGFDPNFGLGSGTGQSRRRSQPTSHSTTSSESGTRLLVNVALNEDLTCFYRLSEMSSCSVEGVVQVQIKTDTDAAPPFMLVLRDPSTHISSIQENKKYAADVSDDDDFKFRIKVPKDNSYFPVMRYKCGDALRPVPVRVQTRVRDEDTHLRVALQISSNPHNEDSLTKLTIIMGVPSGVRGESLTTSPTGGLWNASKRSVIWCIAELGSGEKFQLQARFEVEPDAPTDDEELKFPVLVRCECMHNQLSDIEVDAFDMPDVPLAEVRMKLARRFRLSHRERP